MLNNLTLSAFKASRGCHTMSKAQRKKCTVNKNIVKKETSLKVYSEKVIGF